MVLWTQRLLARIRWALHFGRVMNQRGWIRVGVLDVLGIHVRRDMGRRGVRYGDNRRGTYEHHAEQRKNTKRGTMRNV
jgi:hypothetical protein